jgi:type II secretory pathway component GspD/PulD (secretin)
VTVFSGSTTTVRDESYRPFVVGVSYVKGELATAAQPQIATLTEGSALDVQPIVVDAGALDLRCRLAVSKVDGVSEVKLPGQDVTVQNPRLSRKTITASCRVAPGETLLIAPMIDRSEADDNSEVRYYAITAEWFPDVDMPAAPAGR